jgi:alkanesulfonate monooxygenase
MTFHWYLPTGGDSRWLVTGGPGVGALSARGDRPATLSYLDQVTRGAELLGFAGVVAPTDPWAEDAWLATAMLAGATSKLTFLLPLQPGEISPGLAARMAATFQRYSGGRLLLQVETGADEFVGALRDLWRGETPVPPVYGSGPADVHIVEGKPPEVAEQISHVRSTVGTPRFAIRLHVITRDTSGQAWAEARRLLAGLEPHNGTTMVVHSGGAARLEVYPNLWAGVGLVPGGANLALVGNHAEVANRIEEYQAAGVDEFLLSGHPHLEEAYWFGEGVLPLLHKRPRSLARSGAAGQRVS